MTPLGHYITQAFFRLTSPDRSTKSNLGVGGWEGGAVAEESRERTLFRTKRTSNVTRGGCDARTETRGQKHTHSHWWGEFKLLSTGENVCCRSECFCKRLIHSFSDKSVQCPVTFNSTVEYLFQISRKLNPEIKAIPHMKQEKAKGNSFLYRQ